jgi:hypothetical protein
LIVYWFCVALSLKPDPQADVPLLLLAAMLAFTVKLSAGPLVLFALLAVWSHRRAADVRLLKPIVFVGIFLGLWMARGVALSGCALYPLPRSCSFGLPWGVSKPITESLLLSITSWARSPGRLDYEKVMSDWSWLTPWMARSWEDWSARLFVAGGILGCMAALAGVRTSRVVLGSAAALGRSLTYWFFNAPDVRFGSGYLAAAGILGLSFACVFQFREVDVARRLVLEVIVLMVPIGTVDLIRLGNTRSIKNRPAFVMMVAPGGKQFWVPQVSDQCWDHQLPCSPYFQMDDLKRVRWR